MRSAELIQFRIIINRLLSYIAAAAQCVHCCPWFCSPRYSSRGGLCERSLQTSLATERAHQQEEIPVVADGLPVLTSLP